jgi:hypothetical protein
VLFRKELWTGLADGTVTLAFRRWQRPTVTTSGALKTAVGVLAIDEVVEINENFSRPRTQHGPGTALSMNSAAIWGPVRTVAPTEPRSTTPARTLASGCGRPHSTTSTTPRWSSG